MSIIRKFFDDDFFATNFPRFDEAFATRQFQWAPKTDIKENDKSIVLTAELPGLTLDDVKVEVHDGVLTMKGEKKQEKKEDNENYHRVERSYGSFQRSFRLPEGSAEKDVQANLKNGVLEVVVNKPVIPLPEGPKNIAITQG